MVRTRARGAVVTLVALVGVALLLGACSSSEPAEVAASPTTSTAPVTPSSTAATRPHHRPWSDVNPPPRRAGGLVVKVLALSRVAPGADDGQVRPVRGGPGFWGEEVRTCVERSSPHAQVVSRRDWRAVGLDGRHYVAGAAPDRPAYPAHRRLAPGDCVTGWWLITVPHDRPVRAIQLAPGGRRPLIEWASMR